MKTILIVDDDPDVLDSLKRILRVNEYKVFTASNGEECLEKVNEYNPDLVLLDIMMPGMPVDDVVKQIRDTKIAFISIVRVSDAQRRGLCSQKNVVGFFQKPFDVSDLVEKVELILGTDEESI
jgi:DNA-binding response OmpR family regulator